MNFLIIDEAVLMTRVLMEILTSEGHKCTRLTEVAKALQYLETESPDAVILDVKHKEPGEVRRLVSNILQLCKKPIILYTELGPKRELIKTAIQAGAHGRVSKQMSMPGKFTKAIMKIIKKYEESMDDSSVQTLGSNP